MFRRVFAAIVSIFIISITIAPARAFPIELYADSAPNVYGSPNWAPWWTTAKTDVTGGTFTNMRTGTYPGTDMISPYDEIVYSTGDLGKRVHFIYWIPDNTTAALDQRFQVKWVIDWEGDDWTWNGGWVLDSPNVGWVQPGSWEDYNGGVIGSFGFAWWSTDDDASPGDTGGSPYDEVNQADIDALARLVSSSQTYLTGLVRYKDANSVDFTAGPSMRLTLVPIPEPATLALFGIGLAGLGLLRRRRRAA